VSRNKQIYFNEFADAGYWTKTPPGWARVQEEFKTNHPEPENVLYANYEYQNYEGEANVIWREPNGDISYVSGVHCSCYGLEDQWDVETYPEETVREMIARARETDDEWAWKVFRLPYEELERLLDGTN
jgi:hypothetical protein